MDISKDLKDAIAKNLPTMVGNELQEFLQQANKMKVEHEALKGKHSDSLLEVEALKKRCSLSEAIGVSKKSLEEREARLEVTLAKADTEKANALAKQAFEMVALIFRNPTVMRQSKSSYPVAINNPGGYANVNNYQVEDQIAEEIK